MSRQVIYHDDTLTVVTGDDHMLGKFLQVFDKNMENETPEGEGLVLDWSEGFGLERNLTGIPSSTPVPQIVQQYIDNQTAEKIAKIISN